VQNPGLPANRPDQWREQSSGSPQGGRSVWTPRDTPEPGLRIAFVTDPDGNLVELLSSDEEAPSDLS
jgi:catechol 2,3-dioxygenase-like lactoylglutathione lyase family enzyme